MVNLSDRRSGGKPRHRVRRADGTPAALRELDRWGVDGTDHAGLSYAHARALARSTGRPVVFLGGAEVGVLPLFLPGVVDPADLDSGSRPGVAGFDIMMFAFETGGTPTGLAAFGLAVVLAVLCAEVLRATGTACIPFFVSKWVVARANEAQARPPRRSRRPASGA